MVNTVLSCFLRITQVVKFSQNWKGRNSKDVLLEPTLSPTKAALPLIKEELVNGIAHITGGGFENVPLMFADDAEIDESKVPVLFKALKICTNQTWRNVWNFKMDWSHACGETRKMWNVSKNPWRTLWNRSYCEERWRKCGGLNG